jgi:hypothetical protein
VRDDSSMHSPDGFPCHIHHRHSSGSIVGKPPGLCRDQVCQAVAGRRHARARGARARARIIFLFLN